jgi:GTP-sensing pleiotropic transcriptional regulator CodY
VSLIVESVLLPALLVLAALAGFGIGMWICAEKLRRAEWRIRRAEAMCMALRKVSDEYRRKLRVRTPQQAAKKLEDQERKLGMLRFQVASLSSELKAVRPVSSDSAPEETIDLTDIRSRPPQARSFARRG